MIKQLAGELGVDSRVLFLEYASAKTLDDFYRMADAFIYLSTYEGFGIPPLEAMSYGIPVVLSRTPAMDQIYLDSALFVPDLTPGSIAVTLHSCLTDVSLREKLVQSGLAKVERSRWAETAQIISRDWEKLLAAGS